MQFCMPIITVFVCNALNNSCLHKHCVHGIIVSYLLVFITYLLAYQTFYSTSSSGERLLLERRKKNLHVFIKNKAIVYIKYQ